MQPTSEAVRALQRLPLLHSNRNLWAYMIEWQGLDLNLEINAVWRFHSTQNAASLPKCFLTGKEFNFLHTGPYVGDPSADGLIWYRGAYTVSLKLNYLLKLLFELCDVEFV